MRCVKQQAAARGTLRWVLCALAAAWLACAAAMAHGAQEGHCAASRLGHPCPSGDTAGQGPATPVLNLGAGNPIHLATGNKYQREVDLPGPGTHVGLEIVRHYNAMEPRAGPLGRGWTLSYDTRLHAGRADGLVQIAQADGSRADFRCGAACLPAGDARGRLERVRHAASADAETPSEALRSAKAAAGGAPARTAVAVHWRWHWPDGRTLEFDARGWLAHIADAAGHHVRILRDTAAHGAGAIVEVVDERGDALRFTHETGAAGARLARIDTPYGSYVYSHDVPSAPDTGGASPARHPGVAAQPGGRAYRLLAVAHPAGWRREYLYEAPLQAGHPYLLTGMAWRAAPHAAPLRTHSWAYDARGRAVLSTHGDPASPRDRVEIAYLSTPSPGGGLTRVRSRAGSTDFHIVVRGGRPVLLRVEGDGCPGCAAAGLRADYDARGRLIRLDGLHLARDANGGLLGLRDAGSGWPGLSLSFDALRPRGPLLAWSSDATGRETRRRDAAGRVMERRYANGDVWRHAYDDAGRPVEIIMRSADAALRSAIAWKGDRPVRIDHPHERESRRHDARGRLLSRTVHRPALERGDRPYAYRESHAWDDQGRLVRHDLPEGGRLTYDYDADGRIARIAWQHGQLRQELLRAAPGGGYLHANGLRTRGLLRGGHLDTLAVDDPAAPGRAPILLQRLRHDAAGRIAGEILRIGEWQGAYAYGHDDHGRLAAATATLRRHEARRAMEQAWRYAWTAAGDSAALQADDATLVHRPGRDASGLPVEYDGLRLRYGPDRRLWTVMRGGRELARYTHNAYGERIRRRAGGRAQDYLYAFNRLAAIADALPAGGMGVTHRFVHAGWVPVAMISYPRPRPLQNGRGPSPMPVFHAIHADAIGMPHAVTDQAGQLRWRALWSPTGAAIEIGGDLSMPLRQPGHIHDPATGLHDNYLRTYDPRAGHYLEPDPAGPMPHTQAYGYADQQPRRHIDPHGLLLFAFDGTNRDREARTNVALMSDWYADGTAFYHRGPGFASPRMVDAATGGSSPAILETQWRALLREIAARGTAGTVAIDLLGYSRGAALAMHFGNMIADRHRAGRFWTRDPAMGTVTACADLRFMGLFDTVAQFGVLGSRNADYNLAASAEWRWIAHAVALHERRGLFPLTVPPETGRNVITAPFIGAHGDIGGGYLPHPADPERARPGGDLSDVALAWMLKQAEHAGAAFLPPPAAFQRVDNPVLHDERGPRARRADGDRAVLEGGGDTLLAAQGDHARYGDAARADVEAFIQRVQDWTERDDAAIGTVDMDGYRGWLRRTLGLDALPPGAQAAPVPRAADGGPGATGGRALNHGIIP